MGGIKPRYRININPWYKLYFPLNASSPMNQQYVEALLSRISTEHFGGSQSDKCLHEPSNCVTACLQQHWLLMGLNKQSFLWRALED